MIARPLKRPLGWCQRAVDCRNSWLRRASGPQSFRITCPCTTPRMAACTSASKTSGSFASLCHRGCSACAPRLLVRPRWTSFASGASQELAVHPSEFKVERLPTVVSRPRRRAAGPECLNNVRFWVKRPANRQPQRRFGTARLPASKCAREQRPESMAAAKQAIGASRRSSPKMIVAECRRRSRCVCLVIQATTSAYRSCEGAPHRGVTTSDLEQRVFQ